MSAKKDMTGMRFGRLVVLCEDGRDNVGHVLWRCRCDCGNEVTVQSNNLRTGNTTSCGCFQREITSETKTKHGMTKTRLFNVWHGMLTRTGIYKGASEKVKRLYQDRGISVCDEWLIFENFRDWALSHGYSDDLEIDRIDNDKGYCPENCRWITHKENTNNRKCTIRLSDGTPFVDFCRSVGVETRENGNPSNQYHKYIQWLRTHSCELHPELIRKANETILIYRKCIEMLRLLDDTRQLRQP